MPIKRPQFVNREIYHIILRGIEKRDVFIDEKDHLRFIHDLFEFNDRDAAVNVPYYFKRLYRDNFSVERRERKLRKLLVEILSFCLMPNHVHLILRQLKEKGISLFMQKLGGYSTYFNKKYDRVGSLFQRPFRGVHIKTDDQLMITTSYVHINPADLVEPGWKEEGVKNPKKVMKFLESYRWSSYSDYLGKKNFPSLTQREFLNKIFEGPESHKKFVNGRIYHKAELTKFLQISKELFLE